MSQENVEVVRKPLRVHGGPAHARPAACSALAG